MRRSLRLRKRVEAPVAPGDHVGNVKLFYKLGDEFGVPRYVVDGAMRSGGSILHCAYHFNSEADVATLIARGHDVDYRDYAGNTPLHELLAEYNANCCVDPRGVVRKLRALFAGGADPRACNLCGQTAVLEAAESPHFPIKGFSVLREFYDADPKSLWTPHPDSEKITAAHWLAAWGSLDALEMLPREALAVTMSCGNPLHLLLTNEMFNQKQLLRRVKLVVARCPEAAWQRDDGGRLPLECVSPESRLAAHRDLLDPYTPIRVALVDAAGVCSDATEYVFAALTYREPAAA